jgi:predicted component of type VI protein secretion system
MPAQLVALSEGHRIVVNKPIVLIGRDAECDIQFDSRKISRRHCCIAQIGDQLIVRDLGSTNGIRINGVRVVEGYLKAGDELSIGSHRYQVRWDNPQGQPRLEAKNGAARQAESPAPREAERAAAADQPVALSESAADIAGDLRPPAATPGKPAAPDPVLDAPLPLPDDLSEYNIVPEHIEVAPITDDFPPLSPRRPPKPGG